MIAYAAADAFDKVLFRINANIINPAIEFAFIIAFVVFIWGVFQFIAGADDAAKRQAGKDHILWGIVGFVIMFGVYGIITIVVNTIGVSGLTLDSKQQTFNPPQIQTVNVPK